VVWVRSGSGRSAEGLHLWPTYEVQFIASFAPLENLRCELRGVTEGKAATYIPELAKANPDWFGMCLALADFERLATGGSRVFQSRIQLNWLGRWRLGPGPNRGKLPVFCSIAGNNRADEVSYFKGRRTSPSVSKKGLIMTSIGPTETMHFQTWADNAGNAPPLTAVDTAASSLHPLVARSCFGRGSLVFRWGANEERASTGLRAFELARIGQRTE